jgi:hypothetical protein
MMGFFIRLGDVQTPGGMVPGLHLFLGSDASNGMEYRLPSPQEP